MHPMLQTGRGLSQRTVLRCAAPQQTSAGIIDLQLMLVPEGVLYRSNVLSTLLARRKAYQVACDANGGPLPPGPKHFSAEEDLHLTLLQKFKELVQSQKFWSDGQAAAHELQDEAEAFCRANGLPFEQDDWVFEVMDRVYIGEMPDKEPRCYLVASAISCSGRFGLWQIPEQLSQDLAALRPGRPAAQHAARELLVENHLRNPTKGTEGSFFSTVIPPDTRHLLEQLRQLEMSTYENLLGQQYRLLFRTLSIEKNPAVPLLALELHVDPGGRLLHSNNLILRPRNSGRQVNQCWFSSGSWRLGQQPAGLHTGSTAVLVDGLYMTDWQESQTADLFHFPEDHDNTHKVVRVTTEGVSLYPLKPYETHIHTTLEQLQAVRRGMGWSVQPETEAGESSSSSSSSHSLSVRRAYQHGWTYLGLLQKSRVVTRWWSKQTPEQQQTVQQQHSNIDLLGLMSQLGLPSSRVDSRMDLAACMSAVEQLYRQILPARELQPAVDVWMQSPRLQPHMYQISQHVDSAVAPASAAAAAAAAAARPGNAAGTSDAAAPRQQPNIVAAAYAAAAANPAAATPQKGLVVPEAAVPAAPQPHQHVHDDPSRGSAQPRRRPRRKGARGVAAPQDASCSMQFLSAQYAAGTSAAAAAPMQQPDIAPAAGAAVTPAVVTPAAAAAAVTPAAAVPHEGLVAPGVLAVPDPWEHVHEDPSPGSAQPSRKQKGAAGLAVPQQHAAAGPSSSSAAAADDKVDSGDTSSLKPLKPAAYFLHGGTQHVKQLLEKEGGVQGLIDMGCASRQTVETMERERWVRWEFRKGTKNQPPGTEWTGSKGVRKWGAGLMLNYGGEHLEEQQWECMRQCLDVLTPSSQAVSSAKAFEDGIIYPALVVESGFQLKQAEHTGFECESRGDGLRVTLGSSSTEQLAALREAVFWVTVLLMLWWHSQTSTKKHPALLQFVDQYKLKADRPTGPAQQQTSTHRDREDMQAAMAAQQLRDAK